MGEIEWYPGCVEIKSRPFNNPETRAFIKEMDVMMFFEEAQVIYKSQKNRLGYSSMRRSFNSFGILSGSLVIRAFDHSAHMTTALRQRGYDGRLPELEGKPFKAKEVAGAIVLISVMVVLWKLPLV